MKQCHRRFRIAFNRDVIRGNYNGETGRQVPDAECMDVKGVRPIIL